MGSLAVHGATKSVSLAWCLARIGMPQVRWSARRMVWGSWLLQYEATPMMAPLTAVVSHLNCLGTARLSIVMMVHVKVAWAWYPIFQLCRWHQHCGLLGHWGRWNNGGQEWVNPPKGWLIWEHILPVVPLSHGNPTRCFVLTREFWVIHQRGCVWGHGCWHVKGVVAALVECQ